MAKKVRGIDVERTKDLAPQRQRCPVCDERMRLDYTNRRTLVTLDGLTRSVWPSAAVTTSLALLTSAHTAPRPKDASRCPITSSALTSSRWLVRCVTPSTAPCREIHRRLVERGLPISERTVTNLLDRYDELLSVALTDDRRLKKLLAGQGRVILAIDGLQPDVGHEVLWVIRDCLSGEVLLARSLLSGRKQDLVELLRQVRDGCPGAGRRASSPTASTRSERPSRQACPACRISCASSTTCARRPGRSTRRTGTPRRN